MGIRVVLLGPVAVQTAAATVRPTGQRAKLVAALALAGRPGIGRAALIEWLWDDPPPTARQQLHKLVAALRRMVPELIVTQANGYRLADQVNTDIADFHRLLAGDDVASLTAALDLWRGPALADLDGERAAAAAAAWEDRRLQVVEHLAAQRIADGPAGQVIAELAEELADHPARESLHALHMLALHRTGRTAEALAHYATVRRMLADEFGADPGPELAALHERLLRGEEPGRSGPPERERAPEPAVNTLPFDVPDFTGRLTDLQRLAAAAAHGGVIAIDGMPGVGKTALAVRLAHGLAEKYPDGALFLDLAAHSPTETALGTAPAARLLLAMIGVPETAQPVDQRAVAACWRQQATGRRLIVVLDNAADSGTVTPLLPGGSSALVVVTSRARLADLDGAAFHGLAVMDVPESVELFDRVLVASGMRQLAADPSEATDDAIADVVGWCAGVPLAIRLVAGRLASRPHWSVTELVADLRAGSTGRSVLHGPQSRVHAAFAGAVGALEPGTARALVLLAGSALVGIEISSAAALLDRGAGDTAAVLEKLADAHLLEPRAVGRFTFHDLVREFAADLPSSEDGHDVALPSCDDAAAADLRLREHHLVAVTAAVDQLNPLLRRFAPRPVRRPKLLPRLDDRESALAWLRREHTTLVRLATTGGDWQLACLLRVYFEVQGSYGDWRLTHEYARSVVGADRAGQGYLALNLGALAAWRNDQQTAIREYRTAADLLADQPTVVAGALATIAMLLHQQFDDPAAIEAARAALAIPDAGPTERALAWCNLGLATARTGSPQDAIAFHRRALVEAEAIGDPYTSCSAYLGLGESSLRLRQPAAEAFRSALSLALLQRNRIQQAIALDGLAHATHDAGCWREAAEIYTSLGLPQADLVRRHVREPDRLHCDLCR